MKIVYLGNFSESWRTENWVLEALRFNKVEVIKKQEDNTEIIPVLKKEKPDFFLYSKARKTPDFKEALEYCDKNNIFSVCWLYDVYWRTPRELEAINHPRFYGDLVLTTDGGHNKLWEKYGINHRLLRQGIYRKEAKIVEGDKNKYPEDIVFVGHRISWFPYRDRVMKFLKDTYGDKFAWRGQNNEVRGMELNKLLASAKIVIGDSVYFQKYWSNRVYETIGRGGFLIHPKVAHLEREFEYYKHFVPYDPGNLEQLKEIIDYYLSHDKEREKIRLAGYEYCLGHYTYRARVKQLIKTLKNERSKKENLGVNYSKIKSGTYQIGDRGKISSEKKIGRESRTNRKSTGNSSSTTKGNKKETRVLRERRERDKGVPKITVVLLNYERPYNVRELIKQLKKQEGVELDIWLWDSQPARNGKCDDFQDCKIIRDYINPGIFARWELARMAQTEYVLFADDDIILKDNQVVRDIWERSIQEPDNVIVGWRGVRQLTPKQHYTDAFHTW
ncbi:MAG: glycosyltransferase family protein, partial [Candidatus Heimdallarchaeaceae archaeon]